MKTFLTIGLLLACGTSSFSQEALANKAPKAFGPVRTVSYEDYSVNFNRDKTRIDEGVSNGRTVVWLFTTQNRVLSREVFESDGRPSGTKAIYNYDIAGHLTSIVHYLLGPVSFTETFAYPEARRVKITRVFEPRKDPVIEIDEYDQSGNIVKATIHDDDGTKVEFYKYDHKGNPTEFVGIDPSGKRWIKERYKYEFDPHGNWTRMTRESVSDPRLGIPPKTIVTRRITYY